MSGATAAKAPLEFLPSQNEPWLKFDQRASVRSDMKRDNLLTVTGPLILTLSQNTIVIPIYESVMVYY